MLSLSFFYFYKFIVGPVLQILFGAGYGCRFEESCSEYMKRQLLERGFLQGTYFGIVRVLSCNPWSRVTTKVNLS